jgi:hypothetical protein
LATFTIIRPRDDADARQSSDWADLLITNLTIHGHSKVNDVDDTTPADTANIVAALGGSTDLIFYFGHGDEDNWVTGSASTVNAGNVTAANAKAVVSIACKTACNLGPTAITGGAIAWLGFTIKIAIIAPYTNIDPIGDAIVAGLTCFGNVRTMQQVRDALANNFDQLVGDYDTGGQYSGHPAAGVGYYAAIALRDHVVLHGETNHQPLA